MSINGFSVTQINGGTLTCTGFSGTYVRTATDLSAVLGSGPLSTDGCKINRHDSKLLEPTLDAVDARGLLVEVERVQLDRGYRYVFVRDALGRREVEGVLPRRPKREGRDFGIRWAVERTNSWLSNFGQLRRNTDRRTTHRLAQLALAVALLLAAKLSTGATGGSSERLSAHALNAPVIPAVDDTAGIRPRKGVRMYL